MRYTTSCTSPDQAQIFVPDQCTSESCVDQVASQTTTIDLNQNLPMHLLLQQVPHIPSLEPFQELF
ncbi:hypothetical protein WG66_011814 [Moniliophthora roreri]|nr:hypothetical protein WG66_011814 [Moniliophthora roreri]